MNSERLEQRIIELETRLSYQDHTIEQLNEVVTAQQRQIDRLEKGMQNLRTQFADDGPGIRRPDEETPPPHY
jgi:SlyX protein